MCAGRALLHGSSAAWPRSRWRGHLARLAVDARGDGADVDQEAPPRGARPRPSPNVDIARRGHDEDVSDGHEEEDEEAVDLGAREGEVAAGGARKVLLVVHAKDVGDAWVCEEAAPASGRGVEGDRDEADVGAHIPNVFATVHPAGSEWRQSHVAIGCIRNPGQCLG